MALTTFTAAELARLGGFSYSNAAANAVATKLNTVTAEVPQANPSAPLADTVSSAAGPVSTAFATKYTLAANTAAIGTAIKIKAAGTVTVSAGAVNLTITAKIGSATIGLASAAFDPAAGNSWCLDATVVFQSVGATGKFNSCSLITTNASGTIVNTVGSTYQTSLDTTAAQDVTIVAGWAAGAGETVRLNVLSVDLVY